MNPARPDWPPGTGLLILDATDSTNEEARRQAAAGAPVPLWIMARRQSAGRGRQGRRWEDPGGNLFATCLLRPAMPPASAALLSFAACLAVADTFAALAPDVPVALKWPNDALLNGRKAAGVLLEGSGDGQGMAWLAVGIGINLANAPPQAPEGWPPTSLAAETGTPPPEPEAALAMLAVAFARWAGQLEAEGFEPLRRAWLARAARLGEKVTARLPRETVEGVFTDLDASGALVLSQAGRLRSIQAADVFFA
jgi:BirA family biotin operon repressor/biotin-[acetyl-CoA-carboxylase] ligase